MRKRDPLSQLLDELIDEVSDAVFDAVTEAISPLLPHRQFKRQKRATANREKGGAQPSSKRPRKRPTAAEGGGKGRKGRKLEPTYYEVLGVDSWSPLVSIQVEYRRLATKWHPDHHPALTKAKAEEKMKRINEAWAVLKDSVKRAEYDRRLKAEGRL